MLSTPTFIPNSLTPQSWEAGIREIVYLLSARELKRQNLIRIDLQGLVLVIVSPQQNMNPFGELENMAAMVLRHS